MRSAYRFETRKRYEGPCAPAQGYIRMAISECSPLREERLGCSKKPWFGGNPCHPLSVSKNETDLREALRRKDVHIRNLEAMIVQRDGEIAALRAALSDPAQVGASLDRTKDFGQLPPPAPAGVEPKTGPVQALKDGIFKAVVERHWMRIGTLRQYPARPIRWEVFPPPQLPIERLPQIAIVTPSFNQARFVERTMLSVLDQRYPKLAYVVRDGGSADGSAAVIARQAGRLLHWESAPDRGQADAVNSGFSHIRDRLGPDDVMAWLNSDDLAAPGALRFVAEYFASHPDVDAVYGHRIIIDDENREVGRWILPRHEPKELEWVDYVPQETLFWRKRAWDKVGGLDPSFQFALDWDLLARFMEAGLRVVRVPRFLACFRVHAEQKTSRHIHSTGAEEMARVRTRFHGPEKQGDPEAIAAWTRRIRFRGALTARLHALGIRI